MVHLNWFLFPEGKAYRMARSVEEAHMWRKQIQEGKMAVFPAHY
jgi:hypothetical protein